MINSISQYSGSRYGDNMTFIVLLDDGVPRQGDRLGAFSRRYKVGPSFSTTKKFWTSREDYRKVAIELTPFVLEFIYE